LTLLAEFAGDREDAAAALPAVAARMGIARVEVHVGEWDRRGCEALGRLAVASRLGSGWGTFLPLRMANCMESLRPRIAERCGQAIACAVRFSESGAGPQSRSGKDARLHVFLGPDEAQIVGRASVARFLLGAPDNAPLAFEGSPGVLDALRPAFPLPTPWYGANFT